MLAVAPGPAFAQSPNAKSLPAPWTDAPVRIDPKAQRYERIEASPAREIGAPAKDAFPIRFASQTRFKILDSVSFAEGGKNYRLTDLEPVLSRRICKNGDGERWACGLRARAALGGLLQARSMRCADHGKSDDFILVECRRRDKDIGATMVVTGHAVAAKGTNRYETESAEASEAKAGIWSDISATK